MSVLTILLGVLLLAFAAALLWIGFRARPRRGREPGFEYVWVDDDGSARELDADERAPLQTPFQGSDGARPYIKSHYGALTPDGRMGGYLRRRQLPRQIPINPPPGPV
jgi:hypothetical protein